MRILKLIPVLLPACFIFTFCSCGSMTRSGTPASHRDTMAVKTHTVLYEGTPGSHRDTTGTPTTTTQLRKH